jgi:kumamolisin
MAAQPLKQRRYLSAKELAADYGSNPDSDAVDAVLAFADKHLVPASCSGGAAARQITLTVPVDRIEELFGVRLAIYTSSGHPSYRGREGSISLPKESFSRNTVMRIKGIFGLDNRCQARRFASFGQTTQAQPTPQASPDFPPETYGFPVNPGDGFLAPMPQLTGAGQHIGVVGFGGTVSAAILGVGAQDQIEIAPPQEITQGNNNDFQQETLLDVDIIRRCAPGARITVYAFDQTEQGWITGLDGILQTDPIPNILSISWGWPEKQLTGQGLWTNAAIEVVEELLAALALRGVTVVVSSGDLGSLAQYPASSEFVLSCGGAMSPPETELVWNNHQNASGGGTSAFIEKPAWQGNGIQCMGPLNQPQPSQNRCFPDVAACAVYTSPQVPHLTQGTSAAAPQWSALLALTNEFLAQSGLPPAGHFNSYLYDPVSNVGKSLNDVLSGNNSLAGQLSYVARQGWDACTGWGTPRVMPFLQALASASGRPPRP